MSGLIVKQSDAGLILTIPHTSTYIPRDIKDQFNDRGLAVSDTDWHVQRIYSELNIDATVIMAPVSRYVIDLNRPPDNSSLYPEQNSTGLCPVTDFSGKLIYKCGKQPDRDEINNRLDLYYKPYHQAIADTIGRLRSLNDRVILYDCHSIRSQLPFLFAGDLPDFNIGTNNDMSCSLALRDAVALPCVAATEYTTVVNGRFKGGFTVRHYGSYTAVEAVQMEISQRVYLESERPPWRYNPDKAGRLKAVLSQVFANLRHLP